MVSDTAYKGPITAITAWLINPRLQTRFSPDEGTGELFADTDLSSSDSDTGETTTDSVDSGVDETTTASDDTKVTDGTTQSIDTDADPEELARAEWQKEFDAAPPRVQRALIQEATQRKALQEELERRAQGLTQKQRPQVDPATTDAQLRRFLVDNEKIAMEAQMRAINAQAAGNEAEYEKQLEIMGLARLNIGQINEERARQATANDFSAKARPYQLVEEIRSIKHFEPFHDAAAEIADVHAMLERAVGSEHAYALMDRAMRKIAHAVGGGKQQKAKVTSITSGKTRAVNRSRSETPDGGVASGGTSGLSEKDMDAWVDRVLKIKKQRN